MGKAVTTIPLIVVTTRSRLEAAPAEFLPIGAA